jgi:peptide-methionine (S)-S-oxide reductase
VGYAGGTKVNPTYHNLGDHTETLQIDYDPVTITYSELLNVFWENHDPTYPAWSRQYMAVIFYHNEEQRSLAIVSKEREAARRKGKIVTDIIRAGEFYLAEDYHQKYRLRHDRDLMREFNAMYPSNLDFVNSTSAARANGILDGYGNLKDVESELNSLGLSPEANKKLLEIANKRETMGARC